MKPPRYPKFVQDFYSNGSLNEALENELKKDSWRSSSTRHLLDSQAALFKSATQHQYAMSSFIS
jgi:hypothetical protein